MMLRARVALAAVVPLLLLSGCASSSRFIETATVELGHAPGARVSELGEDGYLQVQVSSNIGVDAERLKFYGSDAPKLIVVTAKLQPLAGPGRDTVAPEVPLLSYDVDKASSEDLTARTLAGGIVVKAGSLTGAATLTLIVRGVTESGAATLGPLMETIKKTPAAITGVATVLGGVPITAFQTFVVPMLEKSATSANRKWERKKEYTFQVADTLDGLDGRVVAFVLLNEDKKRPPVTTEVDLCSLEIENPKLCVQKDGKSVPFTTPYLLFDLRVSDYRPIDDLVAQGGPCATDRATLAKTADAIATGALTGRQAFLEDLLLKRRIVLADIRESGGSIDRLSRAAWRYQRLALPGTDSPRYSYWQRYMVARSTRLDACLDEALASATPTTRRTWATLLDGFKAIDAVDTVVHRYADDDDAPSSEDAAQTELALRRLNTAEAIPAIDAESRAYLVAGVSNASGLLERWYRSEVLRITGSASGPDAANRELKKLLVKTRCTTCASIVNSAISSLQSGASVKSTEAAVRRDSLVVDAVRTGAKVDAAQSLSEANATPVIEQAPQKIEPPRETEKTTVTPVESAPAP